MNIALIWFALFYDYQSPPNLPPTQDANTYCSDQYQFCAKYPASILPFKAYFVQNNGIILKSKDGFSEVVIAAYPQPANTTTESIFYASARDKSILGKEPKIVNSIFGEDYYECFFMIGHHYYYHKSFHFENHYVRVEIKVPLNMPDRMGILRSQISLDFQAEQKLESISGEKAIGSIEE